MADQQVVLEGVLKKKSPSGLLKKMWQERYFKLSTDVIYYYKKKGDKEPQGVIPLFLNTKVEIPDKKKDGRFDIMVTESTSTRTFCLLAKDAPEADKWVNTLNTIISQIQASEHNDGLDAAVNPSTGNNALHLSQPEAGSAKGGQKFWKDTKQLEKIRALKLQSMEANNFNDAQSKKDGEDRSPFLISIIKRQWQTPFGTLYSATNRLVAGSRYVLHAVDKDSKELVRIKLLFHDMRQLSFKFLAKQTHMGETDDTLWVMYEPAFNDKSSIATLLSAQQRFPEDVVRILIAKVVLAVGYIHMQEHHCKNLSPSVLHFDDQGELMMFDPFLCVPPNEMHNTISSTLYRSPDALEGEEDRVSDWWRVGVLMYHLATGETPFKGANPSMSSFATDKISFPAYISDDFKDLVVKLLNPDPAQRLGKEEDAAGVRTHKWFSFTETAWKGFLKTTVTTPWITTVMEEARNKSRGKHPIYPSQHGDAIEITLDVNVVAGRDFGVFEDEEQAVEEPSEKTKKKSKIIGETEHEVLAKLQCEDEKDVTPTVKGKLDKVEWKHNWQFKLREQDPSPITEISFKLYDRATGEDKALGEVVLQLRDILGGGPNGLEGWFPVIDPHGNTRGELQLAIKPTKVVVAAKMMKPHILKKKLASNFSPVVLDEAKYSASANGAQQDRQAGLGKPQLQEEDLPTIDDDGQGNDDEDEEEEEDDHEAGEGGDDDKGGPSILSAVRGMVSKKKIRFQKDGFDLDLTYITPNIIAMGFPSEGTSGVYRNPLTEVQKFFAKYHSGDFKIYNLCSEKQYDHSKFDGKVAEFPFDDHNAPPFHLLLDFCMDVDQFLTKHPTACIAAHCKAGKGRTGTVIACYLVYSGLVANAEDALVFFAKKRTRNAQGVTIPSQRRYVNYFQRYLQQYRYIGRPFPFEGRTLVLWRIRLTYLPNFDINTGCDPYFKIITSSPDSEVIYDHLKAYKGKIQGFHNGEPYADLLPVDVNARGKFGVTIFGDTRFVFYDHDTIGKDTKMCSLWFNTAFIENHYFMLPKEEIDGAKKDKKCEKFHANFKIEFFFHDPPRA